MVHSAKGIMMARATRASGNPAMSETDTTAIETQEIEEHTPSLPNLTAVAELDLMHFIQSALDQLSVESLTQLGNAVREKRHAKQEEAKLTARQTIEEQLRSSGLSLRELFPELLPAATQRRGDGTPLQPKYRGPNGEVWSGRGHTPRWLDALMAEGKHKKEDFLIENQGGGSPLFPDTQSPSSDAA
jgi:DNA-binding protein H-NS